MVRTSVGSGKWVYHSSIERPMHSKTIATAGIGCVCGHRVRDPESSLVLSALFKNPVRDERFSGFSWKPQRGRRTCLVPALDLTPSGLGRTRSAGGGARKTAYRAAYQLRPGGAWTQLRAASGATRCSVDALGAWQCTKCCTFFTPTGCQGGGKDISLWVMVSLLLESHGSDMNRTMM